MTKERKELYLEKVIELFELSNSMYSDYEDEDYDEFMLEVENMLDHCDICISILKKCMNEED